MLIDCCESVLTKTIWEALVRRPAIGVCAAEGIGAVRGTAHSRCTVKAGTWLIGWVYFYRAIGEITLREDVWCEENDEDEGEVGILSARMFHYEDEFGREMGIMRWSQD
jgi:hypothetical protein